ncbi:hypothetical protein QTP86_015517, partial [Hemibagrus guttatus]
VVSWRTKERFWSELDEVMESIPTGERVVIGADFNGHVGEGNTGDEEVMGKFGVKERNLEGQMVVDFAKRMDMGVVNTYFQKREEHRVTYKSGGRSTQVDYILCRRGNLKEISDCKVVVGESVARQHRMVVCRMTLMVCKKKRSEIEKKTKWWKLKKEECCEEFRQKLRQALGGQVVLPDDWETTAEVIRETGRKVLGVSSGRRKEDKETWWWNEEVQDSIQRKRLAKKKWDMDRTEENRQEYKELQRRVKREVSKAKQKAYDELYTRLDTREGEKDLYRLARQRDRDGKDVQQVRVIKDRDGRVLTSEDSVQRRWKEYFEELMNEENEREKRVEGVNSVEQKVDKIRKDEVRKALKRMKSGKAVGPDDIPVEVWKCLGEAAVEFLASLFNRVLESERMPEEWRRSVLVPIFKNKGDVQSCSNYRGIKLMSHTMKVWERVVEARLRKVVGICEQQYGFMPRKSTTDAIFALRILMEKYRDGQKELHCVFVDLEKAYDRVPREELWYCMRKSGVAEKYVRVVQDMYERSRTVVRCAVGQTEEFKVEVGLHQGSALSPFLFAIVMDQLSEEVRQESPWTMMFADDIVICSESREQVEENLERWRFALERRGMKVSRSKTEYMCVNEREGSGTVRLQGEEVKKVQEFKYLGSTVQSNGECGKEVKKRVQAGWNGWRKVSGVLCDQKISARIKGKVYRTVVRPAMLYGLETVSLRKRQESELENPSSLQLESTNLPTYQSGKGYEAISKALGLPRTTVRAIIYKWRKHGTVENLPRSGRPTKITPRAQRQLIQEVTKDPTTTSKELQASLASVKLLYEEELHIGVTMQNNHPYINYGFHYGEERPPVQVSGNPQAHHPTVPPYSNTVPAPAPPINTHYTVTSGHPHTTAARKGISKIRCLCITAAIIFTIITVAIVAVLIWYFVSGVCELGQRCGQSRTCINLSQWCDGRTDCPGGEDEAQCFRFYGPNFMLQSYSNEDQKWKVVCSDRWSNNIGKQTCQQMGYSGSDYVSYGTTDPGSSTAGGYMTLKDDLNTLGSGTVHSSLSNSGSCPTNTAVTLKCIDCGVSNAPGIRIIGGTVVNSMGRWPWQVSLQVKRNHMCGGSVITPSWIVTAAHCVEKYSSPSQWKVYAGYLTLMQMALSSGSSVRMVIPHPDYDPSSNDYDVALMKLLTPLQMSNSIRPVCLPNTGLDFSTSRQYYVTGWGVTQVQGSPSNELREAQVSLISPAVCNSRPVYNGRLTDTMICAGKLEGGVDSCQGDSGGPLVTSENFLWWLVGDTSWGQGCALQNRPGIYGNMTIFVNWISIQIKKY